MKRFLGILAMVIALGTETRALADLEWSISEVKKSVPIGTETVEAEYPFKNTGSTTVTIKSLSPSCGCVAAELEKRTYAPGESGVVKLVMTVGARVGEQNKRVIVEIDQERKFVMLKLLATIGPVP